MRQRVRNLIIVLTMAGVLLSAGTASAATGGPGTMYTAVGGGSLSPSTSGVAATKANIGTPNAIAIDANGDIVVAAQPLRFGTSGYIELIPGRDCGTSCPFGLQNLKRGTLYPIAGYGSLTPTTGGVAMAKANLGASAGMRFDAAGDLLFSQTSTDRVDLLANHSCSSKCPYGLSSMKPGRVYVVAGNGASGVPTTGAVATQTPLMSPVEPTFDARGDLIFGAQYNYAVYLVASSACSSSCPYGLSSMAADHIYPVAGNGTSGNTGDNGPATSAQVYYPDGAAVDADGNLLIADSGTNSIRLVAGANCSSSCPYGLSSLTKGYIYTVPAFSGLLSPQDVQVDAAGDVIVADLYNYRTQLLAEANCSADCPYGLSSMARGNVYTVAGTGSYGNGGSGHPATSTAFGGVYQMALDPRGALWLEDSDNGVVRKVVGGAAMLKLAVSGSGSVTGGGQTCTGVCTSAHAGGFRLRLTPKAGSGSVFAGWTGGGCTGAGMCRASVLTGSPVHAVFRTRSQLAHRVKTIASKVRGKNTRPKRVLKHRGYLLHFNAPAARRLVISWRATIHHRSRLLAIGRVTPSRYGASWTLKIKLTKAGIKQLSAGRRRVTQIAKLSLGSHVKPITLKRSLSV